MSKVKQTRIIVLIVMVVLLIAGWGRVLFGGDTEKEKAYKNHIATGEDYASRGLYQLAIAEYEDAISFNGSEENWTRLLELYKLRYAEDAELLYDYTDAVETAFSAYKESESFITLLTDLYLKDDNYSAAYRNLEKAVATGSASDKVQKLYLEVKYAYEPDWISYINYLGYSDGQFVVQDDSAIKYVLADGSDSEFSTDGVSFASGVGDDGKRLIYDGTKTRLVDDMGVIYGFFSFVPTASGVFSEELIGVQNGEKYAYYDSLGDKKFGDYKYAGAFQDGKAAVWDGSKWYLINQEGAKASIAEYADIVLNQEGKYLTSGVMAAKLGNEYRLYNDAEEVIGDFVASDIDMVTEDGLVAFCRDGKWGYVDLEGNVVIAPTYAGAKSFSNGLAAVFNGSKWGFINKDGQLVIDYIFTNADYFTEEGSCMIQTDENMWQLIFRRVK